MTRVFNGDKFCELLTPSELNHIYMGLLGEMRREKPKSVRFNGFSNEVDMIEYEMMIEGVGKVVLVVRKDVSVKEDGWIKCSHDLDRSVGRYWCSFCGESLRELGEGDFDLCDVAPPVYRTGLDIGLSAVPIMM